MVIIGLIILLIMAFMNAAPLTFFAMLFFGNLGLHISFLALLPGAMAVKFISHNIVQLPTAKNIADANKP